MSYFIISSNEYPNRLLKKEIKVSVQVKESIKLNQALMQWYMKCDRLITSFIFVDNDDYSIYLSKGLCK